MQISATTEMFVIEMNNRHPEHEFTATAGRKFDKVTSGSRAHGSASVHAFVERDTGGLYKPAGYNARAKGVRHDISDPYLIEATVQISDPYGGYLYK